MKEEQFLLIKATGKNLWENVHQLMDYLLLAEITNRIPVVFWSSDYTERMSIFNMYFETVSRLEIYHLMKSEYTFYPTEWEHNNLTAQDLDVERKRFNAWDVIESTANVVVCDSYLNRFTIYPYIQPEHEVYGMERKQIYRYLFKKYLRLKPEIQEEINHFFEGNIKEEPVLGVHVPDDITLSEGTNPFIEQFYSEYYDLPIEPVEDVENVNETVKLHRPSRIVSSKEVQDYFSMLHKVIKEYLGMFSINKLFLVTDSRDVWEQFNQVYGSILISTDSYLNRNELGISNKSIGISILKDTYLASKCDFFIGDGNSYLSHAVNHLKAWPDTNVKLMYWSDSELARKKKVNPTIYPENEFVDWYQQLIYYYEILDKWKLEEL